MNPEQCESFISEFVDWASAQKEIQAVALVGSYARGTASDESDLDLVILSENPKQFLEFQVWLHNFGTILGRQEEDYGKVTSLRVWFEGEMEIEFGFAAPDWAAIPVDDGTRRVVKDGMRILFDRSTLLSDLQSDVNR